MSFTDTIIIIFINISIFNNNRITIWVVVHIDTLHEVIQIATIKVMWIVSNVTQPKNVM